MSKLPRDSLYDSIFYFFLSSSLLFFLRFPPFSSSLVTFILESSSPAKIYYVIEFPVMAINYVMYKGIRSASLFFFPLSFPGDREVGSCGLYILGLDLGPLVEL